MPEPEVPWSHRRRQVRRDDLAPAATPELLVSGPFLDKAAPDARPAAEESDMHIRSGPHGHELNTEAVSEAEDRHRAFCSCGDWEHERLVDPGNPLDRAEFENAWFEHVNPGART